MLLCKFIYKYTEACVIVFNSKDQVKYINDYGRKLFKYPKGSTPLNKKDFIKKDIGICHDGSIIKIDVYRIFKNTIIVKRTEQNFIQDIEDLTRSGHWQWRIDNGELTWSSGLKSIYELEEVDYEKYMKCNHPEDVKLIKDSITKCLSDKQNYSIIHRIIKNKSKKQVWLKAVGRYIKREGVAYLIGSVQDITQQVEIERGYIDKKEKAEEESQTKTDFVSSVSHELRTPLNGIIGMVSLLRETELSPLQKRYSDILQDSCGVLLSIINNILNFSKIKAGKIQVDYEYFNVKTFLSPVISLFRPSAVAKGVALNFYTNTSIDYITSDQLKIKQVVSNLLSNSIKFTKKGTISLTINCTDETLTIIVKDTGIGISDKFLKVITTPFSQEDGSCTREFGGSGLGLSIARSYIELLNGYIDIKSDIGKGTKITVTIPISTSKKIKSIIIVEDNKMNQIILKELLSRIDDFHIITYDTTEEALSNLKEEPSIIFMDLHMPGMDGYTCSNKIREIGYTCPIIAFTADFMKSDRIACLRSNMDGFLLKPVKYEDVKNILLEFKIIS